MSQSFIVTGSIESGDPDRLLGGRVEAYDRDLPSLEQRGATPQLLGQSPLEKGRRFRIEFKIEFTDEQFRRGEGNGLVDARASKIRPDLSFRVFDRAGRELTISRIVAENRERPGLIIFNAPPTLDNLEIKVELSQDAGESEYEQLIALIAPVVQNLSLFELSDADVAFLINELDLNPPTEVQLREGIKPGELADWSLEWLRRAALLAQRASVPIEAFYGWGRMDLPKQLIDLFRIPSEELDQVLEDLFAIEAERLARSLKEAAEKKIIPNLSGEAIKETVTVLRRRRQIRRDVNAQLRNSTTDLPLSSYTVTTLDADNNNEDLGTDITGLDGSFIFSFFVPEELPQDARPRRFRFKIQTADGVEIPEMVEREVDSRKEEAINLIVPVLIRSASAEIRALQNLAPKNGKLKNKNDKLKKLVSHLPREVKTLADIRRKGGLARMSDLPKTDSETMQLLKAHADLDRISHDVSVNDALISRGYDSVLKIAETPPSEFVRDSAVALKTLSKPDVYKLHVTAQVQTSIMRNLLGGMAANHANGFAIRRTDRVTEESDRVFEQQCGCSDCEAAVSPGAYLAELLDYALKRIRNSDAKIELQFLVDTFHQPFADLPMNCGAIEQQLRQVRLCTEVLRSYVGKRPLADPVKEKALAKSEDDYRVAVYSLLLSKLGTSYEEIRGARNNSALNRKALAERLGIHLTEPRPSDPPGDELDQLFLDPTVAPSKPHALTEHALEVLFGLPDTTRDPLSGFAKLNDDKAQIIRWNLTGIDWNHNTDENGLVYVTLSKNLTTGVVSVALYKEEGRKAKAKVASGEISADNGKVKLNPENDSKLSGVFEISYFDNTKTIAIAAVPKLLSWQLKHLRTLWTVQDHPVDVYSDDAEVKLPLIDPDLIGPDDFRHPFAKSNKAFDIWLKRRKWIDQRLTDRRAEREKNGLTLALRSVFGNPLPDLEGLLFTLTAGVSEKKELDAAKKKLESFGVTVAGFSRLMEIRTKDQLAQTDKRNQQVSADEWSEFDSILTQALKIKQFDAWRAAERSAGITLSLKDFWFSVTEPGEGDWPPLAQSGRPLIDPGLVKLTDLADWLAGKEAAKIWSNRKKDLDKIPGKLKTERESKGYADPKGFRAVLKLVYGTPVPDVETLHKNLTGSDETTRTSAANKIQTSLLLTIENFKQLVALKAKNDETDDAKKPTGAEWAELYAILTPVYKVRNLYSKWLADEKTKRLFYWQAVKAKLPRWRGSLEARKTWRDALRTRRQRPIIDPHVIGDDDLRYKVSGPAFDVWKSRYDDYKEIIKQLRTEIKSSEKTGKTIQAFDKIIETTLGASATDLAAVEKEQTAGRSVSRRLDQLNLTYGSFTYLVQMRRLAENNQLITDAEWGTIFATLAGAGISRGFTALSGKEKQDENQKEKYVNLSPDYFKIATTLTRPLPFLESSTPLWLSTSQPRRIWQDALQSRIDQQTSLTEALRNAVSDAEEALLPALRNGVIQASDASGVTIDDQSAWITDRLLIDAKGGGCKLTTRVEQAIETTQALIFGLRTAQLKFASKLPLVLISDYFDEEWKWIGSYATWRAAMFVFLYPENILQPSLMTRRTPRMDELINDTRGLPMDPDSACEQAQKYSAYFRDVCSLEIEATCQARTEMFTGEGCNTQPIGRRPMFYMFGRAPSGKVYWSACEIGENWTTCAQTFWYEVTAFSKVETIRIIGAMPYRMMVTTATSRPEREAFQQIASSYIYLFCDTVTAGTKTLKFAKLDLDDFGAWSQMPDLSNPFGNEPSIEIVPVQTPSEFVQPALIFHKPGAHEFYYRRLNVEGTGWEGSTEWPQFLNTSDWPYLFGNIKAALQTAGDIWIVHNDILNGSLELIGVELKGGGRRMTISKNVSLGDKFLGAIAESEADPRSSLQTRPKKYSSAIYVFFTNRFDPRAHPRYLRITSGFAGEEYEQHDALADLVGIAPHSGNMTEGEGAVVYKRNRNSGAFYLYRYKEFYGWLIGKRSMRVVPRVKTPLNIPYALNNGQLKQRRQDIISAFDLNSDAPAAVTQYLREAFYFVPLHLALSLQQFGYYLQALDWLRTIYNYAAPIEPINKRNIYYGLELDAKLPAVPLLQHASDWLLDPLNPHLIAVTRPYAYTRFTLVSLVRCLLDYADAEFTAETGESLAKARTLYSTALDLLNLPELQQKLGVCDELIAQFKVEAGVEVPPAVQAAVGELIEDLTKGAPWVKPSLEAAVKEAGTKLRGNGKWSDKLDAARQVARAADATKPVAGSLGESLSAKSVQVNEKQSLLLSSAELDSAVQDLGTFVASEILQGPNDPAAKLSNISVLANLL